MQAEGEMLDGAPRRWQAGDPGPWLIRELRSDDPAKWTYVALAKAVGCSPELIAAIIKERV